MTNERLQRLSIQLSTLFNKEYDTPQDYYEKLSDIAVKQKIYFNLMSGSDLLKLSILSYLYNTRGNFDLASKLFNNLFFAFLFEDSGEPHTFECVECSGDGDVTCSDCDGDGNITCDECNGTGMVDCSECDGTGENSEGNPCNICDGEGEVECDECGGRGDSDCPNCYSGSETCPTCRGNGTLEGEGNNLKLSFICSWDMDLKNRCEMYAHTSTPVISSEGLAENNEIIVLDFSDWGEEDFVNDDIEEEMVYCWEYLDDVDLKVSGKMKLFTSDFLAPNSNDFTF